MPLPHGKTPIRPFDVSDFIKANLRLLPVPLIPEIRLYTAHSGSGLSRLASPAPDADDPAPYWAYVWAGGAAIARHILDNQDIVRDRRVLDLGAGSGLVGIAAALAGAAAVTAAEIDANGHAAIALNSAANGVSVEVIGGDLLPGMPPDVDLVLVGDLLYESGLAGRVVDFLDRCRLAGIEVLVGDPGRKSLPRKRLRLIADYGVADIDDRGAAPTTPGMVFAFD